jgi:signal transduction histidine kinase
MLNMTDRVGALGGTLEVRSTPGAGTTVAGTVPV